MANPPIIRNIKIIDRSVYSYTITVTPRDESISARVGAIAHDCQVLADFENQAVVLIDKQNTRHTFNPQKNKLP